MAISAKKALEEADLASDLSILTLALSVKKLEKMMLEGELNELLGILKNTRRKLKFLATTEACSEEQRRSAKLALKRSRDQP